MQQPSHQVLALFHFKFRTQAEGKKKKKSETVLQSMAQEFRQETLESGSVSFNVANGELDDDGKPRRTGIHTNTTVVLPSLFSLSLYPKLAKNGFYITV